VARFASHVDGVVVGSALLETLERGGDVGPFSIATVGPTTRGWKFLEASLRAASLLQVAHARNVLTTAGIQSELRNQYVAAQWATCRCWKRGRSSMWMTPTSDSR